MSELFSVSSLRLQRDRRPPDYDQGAAFIAEVEQELANRLSLITLDAQRILVLGTVAPGTLRQLAQRFSQAELVIADCSGARLRRQQNAAPELAERTGYVLLEGCDVSAVSGTFDLVFSSFYLPLCDDFGALFGQLYGRMQPQGCVHFSALGPDSFVELRRAWAQVDPENPFHGVESPDMHDVGDALVHAGFREPVMDRETYTLTYSRPAVLFDDLRNFGVGNALTQRFPGLTGRHRWQAFTKALHGEGDEAALTMTVEVVMGQAWRGEGMSQQRRADGDVGIALDDLARQLRKSTS